MLLWALIFSGWTPAVALLSRSLPQDMVARVLGVMGIISVGFLLYPVLPQPFIRLLPDVPQDGGDLNPLLQDIGLIMHPPLLYMGYVGFRWPLHLPLRPCWVDSWMPPGRGGRVPGRQSPGHFSRSGSPWEVGGRIMSWVGGWWFWDPVENASLMPWLAVRRSCTRWRSLKSADCSKVGRFCWPFCVFVEPAGNLPGTFRHPDLCTCVCGRSRPG